MMTIKLVTPLAMLAALCLAACNKPENAARREPTAPAAETAAAEKTAPVQTREVSPPSAEKPPPKLVLVKPLGDRTDSRPMLFQSTAPVAAAPAANSVTIINNAVPEVQGTAVPAQAPDPKKPVGQPVY